MSDQSLDRRLADRLRVLRVARGWSLDALSRQCGISRATLSRLENADVSPTASVLGKLCAVYGLTMSRLMAMVETAYAPLIPRGQQAFWQDPETGFTRRSVSPPTQSLAAELLVCELPAGKRIEYRSPPRAGLEHHIYLLDGTLKLTVGERLYRLNQGDCVRYQLHGPSLFETGEDKSAKYILVVV